MEKKNEELHSLALEKVEEKAKWESEKEVIFSLMRSMESSHNAELEKTGKITKDELKVACFQIKKKWYHMIYKECREYSCGFVLANLRLAYKRYGGEGVSF